MKRSSWLRDNVGSRGELSDRAKVCTSERSMPIRATSPKPVSGQRWLPTDDEPVRNKLTATGKRPYCEFGRPTCSHPSPRAKRWALVGEVHAMNESA
jgi:hypothetical protein